VRRLSNGCVNAPKIEKGNVGKFILAPEAFHDLDLIWAFIASDNPEAADRVLEAAYGICKILAEYPELGRQRHFVKPGLSDI